MQIGEAAAASGCHLETIRYYERIGLLPETSRLANGYRDYAVSDVERLRFIVRARDLGFSLDEIRRLLMLSASADLSCSEVDQLARQQLAAVKKRINELRRMARELQRTIDSCARQSCGECTILGALHRAKPNRSRVARRREAAPLQPRNDMRS